MAPTPTYEKLTIDGVQEAELDGIAMLPRPLLRPLLPLIILENASLVLVPPPVTTGSVVGFEPGPGPGVCPVDGGGTQLVLELDDGGFRELPLSPGTGVVVVPLPGGAAPVGWSAAHPRNVIPYSTAGSWNSHMET